MKGDAGDEVRKGRLAKAIQFQDHRGAGNLLKKADHESARNLDLLLGVKTRAGYGYDSVSVAQLRRTMRSMDALVEFARQGTR